MYYTYWYKEKNINKEIMETVSEVLESGMGQTEMLETLLDMGLDIAQAIDLMESN